MAEKRREDPLSSLGGENFRIIVALLAVGLIVTNLPFLRSEISYEFQYSEINMLPGENFTYRISINNIGLENVNLSYSAVGINQIALGFNPNTSGISPRAPGLINISIDTNDTLPGDYQGFIYIRNADNQQILEKIPLIIKVKEINQTFDT